MLHCAVPNNNHLLTERQTIFLPNARIVSSCFVFYLSFMKYTRKKDARMTKIMIYFVRCKQSYITSVEKRRKRITDWTKLIQWSRKDKKSWNFLFGVVTSLSPVTLICCASSPWSSIKRKLKLRFSANWMQHCFELFIFFVYSYSFQRFINYSWLRLFFSIRAMWQYLRHESWLLLFFCSVRSHFCRWVVNNIVDCH